MMFILIVTLYGYDGGARVVFQEFTSRANCDIAAAMVVEDFNKIAGPSSKITVRCTVK